jgi:hypothetical protein
MIFFPVSQWNRNLSSAGEFPVGELSYGAFVSPLSSQQSVRLTILERFLPTIEKCPTENKQRQMYTGNGSICWSLIVLVMLTCISTFFILYSNRPMNQLYVHLFVCSSVRLFVCSVVRQFGPSGLPCPERAHGHALGAGTVCKQAASGRRGTSPNGPVC